RRLPLDPNRPRDPSSRTLRRLRLQRRRVAEETRGIAHRRRPVNRLGVPPCVKASRVSEWEWSRHHGADSGRARTIMRFDALGRGCRSDAREFRWACSYGPTTVHTSPNLSWKTWPALLLAWLIPWAAASAA